jgi:hypothetical protein
MANLYILMFGKSKSKMRPIMIDKKHKCENYRDARGNVRGFHDIVDAPPGVKPWRQKSSTIGGNKADGKSGYISKSGFQHHT